MTQIYDQHGLRPAIETVEHLLDAAKGRGEVVVADSRVAAGQFIAMLRGNLHLEAMLELRPAPTAAEMDERVRSAVRIFLHGGGAATA